MAKDFIDLTVLVEQNDNVFKVRQSKRGGKTKEKDEEKKYVVVFMIKMKTLVSLSSAASCKYSDPAENCSHFTLMKLFR